MRDKKGKAKPQQQEKTKCTERLFAYHTWLNYKSVFIPGVSFRKKEGAFATSSYPNMGRYSHFNHTQDPKSIWSGWAFSALSLSREEAIRAVSQMLLEAYKRLNTQQNLSFDKLELSRAINHFVLSLEKRYFSSAFHSFHHAVDVAQMIFMVATSYLSRKIRQQDLFFLLVAALCHDLQHIGLSTDALHLLGLLNPGQTLEDFHHQIAKELVDETKQPLFSSHLLTETNRNEIHMFMAILIDATDVGKCEFYIEKAKLVRQSPAQPLHLNLLTLLMKISDLANICRSFENSIQWANRLAVESYSERIMRKTDKVSEHEKKLSELWKERASMSVSLQKTCEEKPERKDLAQITLSFVDTIVEPILSSLHLLDNDLSLAFTSQVMSNKEKWRNVLGSQE